MQKTGIYNKTVCGGLESFGVQPKPGRTFSSKGSETSCQGLQSDGVRMSLSVSGFVFSFPLIEACCKNDAVLHGKSVISTWLKCNPLSLQGPEPSKLLTDPEDSLLIHVGPAKKPLDRSRLLCLSCSCLLRGLWNLDSFPECISKDWRMPKTT